MRSSRVRPDAHIDITAEVCPMTFVRTKIALERLPVGGVLEVRLKGDEPLRNVPESARDLGHTVLGLEPLEDGTWRLFLRREGAGC
jgi:tRNA 2-thiouridine synthesizing protein A